MPGWYASTRNLLFFPSNVAVLPFLIFIQNFKPYHINLYTNGHVFNHFHIHVIPLKFFTPFLLSFLPWRNSLQWAKASSLLRIHDHTHLDTPHSVGLSGRVISPRQRPLPDNTQHSQKTIIYGPGEIRTHNPSKRAATDPRLRPRGHWDRLFLLSDVIK